MIFRKAYLTIATAAAVVTIASLPAGAAMPVAGASLFADDGLVVQIAQKKKPKKKTELDRSIDQGTVPARYRSRVPREYQQYIPFEKGR